MVIRSRHAYTENNVGLKMHLIIGGGRVERRLWVNFQCRGVLLVWIVVGQGPIVLAVGAGGGLFGHFFSHLSFLSPSLWETARYRLKYCLKGPLNPKQPTNQPALDNKFKLAFCINITPSKSFS